MFASAAMVGAIAGIAGSAAKEALYQDICKAAKEAGGPVPDRVVIKHEVKEPKESNTPWWSLALAVVIGANL